MSELKLVWPVILTGDYAAVIFSPVHVFVTLLKECQRCLKCLYEVEKLIVPYFERLFKYLLSLMRLLFLYYSNEETDEVINHSTIIQTMNQEYMYL